jgi:RND family efflux transporter MFP subunit
MNFYQAEPVSLPPEASPPLDTGESVNPTPNSPGGRKPHRWGITHLLIISGLIAMAVIGIAIRYANTKQLTESASAADTQIVSVTQPQKAPAIVSLALPGQTQAFTQAPIYAQANGYLKKWNFDIGARIKTGDILADIDTPALDQQLAQAQASLKQAQAALWLSQATYDRYDGLLKAKVISAQDFDNQTGDYREKDAAVATDQANLAQIQALLAFNKVVAPFDGIVSARNTDIGALINSNSGTALFTIAQINPLRVYVNVPQTLAAAVKLGTKADVTFDTFPGRKFPAQVVATAGAIDPGTRTLLTQLSLPNDNDELLPGAYATVHLKIDSGSDNLLVPSNVLLFRSEGASVGVVGPDNTVTIRQIKIGRDLGDKLQIVEGLQATDQVILNPSDSLTNGEVVEIAKAATTSPPNAP